MRARTARLSKALLHRMRMERLRGAARLAGAAAAEAERLREQFGSLEGAVEAPLGGAHGGVAVPAPARGAAVIAQAAAAGAKARK